MTEIYLETLINAPRERCFDLARSIDLHKIAFSNTSEKAIAGRTEGLIENGETVTWEAVHFGVRQKLTSIITKMDKPVYFCDEMVEGAFRSMRHDHFFEIKDDKTLMIDKFFYETPFSIFGAIFDRIILKNYMTKFLEGRNQTIKKFAESDEWKKVLGDV